MTHLHSGCEAHTQWRSQNTADARAQCGHTIRLRVASARTQAPPSFKPLTVRNAETSIGDLGDAPPENFEIFELHRSILRLL